MTLCWIGSRTRNDGVFNPAGLGRRGASDDIADTDLLPVGSVLIEADIRPVQSPTNLIRYATLHPWASGLTVCLEPDGTLRLLMRQGGKHLETALRTSLGMKVQTVHITYVWDAPARKGCLSVFAPDHGKLWQTDVMNPFPISVLDARRIVTDERSCVLAPHVEFVAISDGPCPTGPQPGLSGTSAIATPDGPVPVHSILPGDMVVTDAGVAEVIWAGATTLPALGRFAPMTLRSPYMGLWDDLVTAHDQRVCLAGSEVEYLFGEERVTTAIRHLGERNCAVPTRPCPPVIQYHQVLLSSHEIITVNGAKVESFDGSSLLEQPQFLGTSVLADMPDEDRPKRLGLAAPVLQGYEALTLTGVSIG